MERKFGLVGDIVHVIIVATLSLATLRPAISMVDYIDSNRGSAGSSLQGLAWSHYP